jgi:hypothetical protein
MRIAAIHPTSKLDGLSRRLDRNTPERFGVLATFPVHWLWLFSGLQNVLVAWQSVTLPNDNTFLSWIIGQSGVGALAAFALWLLDRSYRDSLRREKETVEQGREDRRLLMQVLSENAKSNTALQATIENMTRTIAQMRSSRGIPGA